jgi:hypothetical protein
LASEYLWIAVLFLATFWIVPPLGNGWYTAVENFFSKLAKRRAACVLVLFFSTILIRLLLLPVIPYPRPLIHDEFSYLTQADIFAHGRLAFPSHPMARYLETFYVNFQPTYSSIYPPAQSAVLALGEVLGNPWIGVLLSTAAMVAAILWMLQGWFPPHWALLGGTLVLLRLAIFSYWMNSYWGGSVAAVGAALVLGALARMFRIYRPRFAFILGIGLVILANSRPLEGFIFCLPVAALLIVRFVRMRNQGHPSFPRLVYPILGCLLFSIIFTLYYNWRVTGDPITFPHALYYKQYVSVPIFLWGKVLPPLNYANREFSNFYGVWVRDQYDGTWQDALQVEKQKVEDFSRFFLGPFLSVTLISLPWLFRDRRMRFPLLQCVFSGVGLFAVTWFLPHYAAPVFCTGVIIFVQAFRHLRRWRFGAWPVGVGWSRLIVSLSIFMLPICAISRARNPDGESCLAYPYNWDRANIVAQLNKLPGKQLVIVRYSPTHDVHREWVYNSADIDRSKIVWAREIPDVNMVPLLDYFSGRTVWIVEPDAKPPIIRSFPTSPQTTGANQNPK